MNNKKAWAEDVDDEEEYEGEEEQKPNEKHQESSPSTAPPLGATSKPEEKSDKFYDKNEDNGSHETGEEFRGRRGSRRRGGRRRGSRGSRGRDAHYEKKEYKPAPIPNADKKSLRELVPPAPNEPSNINPMINKRIFRFLSKCLVMYNDSQPPYMIHFLNCPKDLTPALMASLFDLKESDIQSIEDMSETNNIPHCIVVVNDLDIIETIYDKYNKNNVFFNFENMIRK